MSPRYAGPAALAVGVALAALVVMSAESVCGVLLRRRGPLQWVSPAACAQAVADGRHVLGAVETRHGIFPQPPAPVHVTGPDPVVSYASDQVEDLRFPVNVGERVGTGLVWLPHKSFRFVRRVKGRSSHRVQMEFPDLRKRYWGRHFWGRGYFCTTSGNITDDAILHYLSEHEPTGVSR